MKVSMGSRSSLKMAYSSIEKRNLCWKKNGDEAAVNSEPREANVSVEFRNERVVHLHSHWAQGETPMQNYLTLLPSHLQQRGPMKCIQRFKSQISKGKTHSGGMYHKPNNLKEVCCPACSLLCLLAGKFTDRHVHVTDCLLGTSPLKNPRSYLLSTRCPVTLKFGLPILAWHVWLHMVK